MNLIFHLTVASAQPHMFTQTPTSQAHLSATDAFPKKFVKDITVEVMLNAVVIGAVGPNSDGRSSTAWFFPRATPAASPSRTSLESSVFLKKERSSR